MVRSMWNNPPVSSNRRRRAIFSSAWAFALTLVIAAGWGFVHTLKEVHRQWDEFRTVQHQLGTLEDALIEMERALVGLAHTDSAKVRFAGYDPARLYAQLRSAYRQADLAVGSLTRLLSGSSDLALQQQLIHLELEWAQTRSRLADYITIGDPARLSLTTLRTFRFREGETIGQALRDFKAAYHAQLDAALHGHVRHLAGYGTLGCVGFVAIAGLLWTSTVRPLRWLRAALERPSEAARYEARLLRSEWAEVYRTLRFYERRLREVEIFIRDLAMGRTPQPLIPTDAADPLARSAEWLLKRIDQLKRERREAV